MKPCQHTQSDAHGLGLCIVCVAERVAEMERDIRALQIMLEKAVRHLPMPDELLAKE